MIHRNIFVLMQACVLATRDTRTWDFQSLIWTYMQVFQNTGTNRAGWPAHYQYKNDTRNPMKASIPVANWGWPSDFQQEFIHAMCPTCCGSPVRPQHRHQATKLAKYLLCIRIWHQQRCGVWRSSDSWLCSDCKVLTAVYTAAVSSISNSCCISL